MKVEPFIGLPLSWCTMSGIARNAFACHGLRDKVSGVFSGFGLLHLVGNDLP